MVKDVQDSFKVSHLHREYKGWGIELEIHVTSRTSPWQNPILPLCLAERDVITRGATEEA